MPHSNVQSYSRQSRQSRRLLRDHGTRGAHPGTAPAERGASDRHGWKVTASGKFFQSSFYGYSPKDGITGLDPKPDLDYDEIARVARREQPRVIVAGASSYPRIIDFEAFRKIADEVGAILIADVSHINGLIVGGVHPSPSGFADVVTSTTHKLLRGPRGAVILSSDRKIEKGGKQAAVADLVDKAVFPFLQGGPHLSAMASLAVALNEAAQPSFKVYAQNVVKNAQSLAGELIKRGFHVVTGGTDNHLMVLDVQKSHKLRGKDFARLLDQAGIECNFNTVPGDPLPPANPSGIRIGSPALTSRGFDVKDMQAVAAWIHSIAEDASEKNIRRVRGEIYDFCSDPKYSIPGLPPNSYKQIYGSIDWRSEWPFNLPAPAAQKIA